MSSAVRYHPDILRIFAPNLAGFVSVRLAYRDIVGMLRVFRGLPRPAPGVESGKGEPARPGCDAGHGRLSALVESAAGQEPDGDRP